jgi:hypothetical protein
MSPISRLGCVFGAAIVVAFAQAPDGFRTHKDPALGLSFYYPVGYMEIPLEPTESAARARYVKRGKPKDERLSRMLGRNQTIDLAYFEIVVIAREARVKSSERGTTPSAGAESRGSDATSKPAESEGPKSLREAMEEAHRIHGFDEFKKKKLGGFEVSPIGLPQGGFREWSLKRKGQKGDAEPTGYCAFVEEGELLLGAYGETGEGDFRTFSNALRRVAKSVKEIEGKYADEALELVYRNSKLKDVPKRIEVRRGLARGWKAKDTDNFIIVYHTPNERFVNKTARDLEAIRPFYEKVFPPAKPLTEVAIVRLCKDMAEYMSYGAPPGSGGFFHPGNEELVLFDYKQTEAAKEGVSGRRLSDQDSFIVLYHEAFHQYIHYAVGEVAPHDWFNEGHGDYFSGALLSDSGRVHRIGPSPWRVDRAKDLASGKAPGWVPVRELVRAPRELYYRPDVRGNFYVLGWAFTYFLREAPEAKSNPSYAKIVDVYFDTLKSETAKGVKALGDSANLASKTAVGKSARELAIQKAMEGVDEDALDAAVRAYVAKIKT